MTKSLKLTAIAAAAAGMVATSFPAAAIAPSGAPSGFGQTQTMPAQTMPASADEVWNQYRNDNWREYNRRGYGQRRYYDEPVYRNTRVWRGNDGRTYCRKKNGTTGLIIGGAAGALLGREIDGGRNRALGTILGAAGGALLGREVDRGGSRCR